MTSLKNLQTPIFIDQESNKMEIHEPPKSEFLARYYLGKEELFAENKLKIEIDCYRDISKEGEEALINCIKQVINDFRPK